MTRSSFFFEKKAKLLKMLEGLGLNAEVPRLYDESPLISIEDFFSGNEDVCSIGVNLMDGHPGLDMIWASLKEMQSDPSVKGVAVQIFDIEWALKDPDCWRFSERVFVFAGKQWRVSEKKLALLKCDTYIVVGEEWKSLPSWPGAEGCVCHALVWD